MATYNGSTYDGTNNVVYLRSNANNVGIAIYDGVPTTTTYYRATVTGAVLSTTGTIPAGSFFVSSSTSA